MLTFKIEQIAICPKDPVKAKELLKAIGAVDWAEDHVAAKGEVFNEKGSNEADLSFNYTLFDGKEFEGGKSENYKLTLGEGRLLKDFENQVVGLAAGGEKSFEIRFPEDYHGKELAGKTATFDVKLKQVEAPELPPVDAVSLDFSRVALCAAYKRFGELAKESFSCINNHCIQE